MAKPTMLQSLLGRPTQTYSFPEEKVYHSTKQDMFRIAAETNDQRPIVVHNAPKKRVIKSPTAVRALDTTSLLINGDRGVDPVHDDSRNDNEESDSDVFYTPNSSPRTSMASTIGPLRTPSPKSATAVHSTKTSFTHANTSTTSISSSALDAHSLFSYANSDSTRMTSPVQSETEHHPITRVKHLNGAPPPPPQVVNGHANQE
ncbi:hypothetical protein H0H93_002461 [Arthromyces matolae]|nr:hypothetical protein H0H93_002461 [Arthromyces matolae]